MACFQTTDSPDGTFLIIPISLAFCQTVSIALTSFELTTAGKKENLVSQALKKSGEILLVLLISLPTFIGFATA